MLLVPTTPIPNPRPIIPTLRNTEILKPGFLKRKCPEALSPKPRPRSPNGHGFRGGPLRRRGADRGGQLLGSVWEVNVGFRAWGLGFRGLGFRVWGL